MAVKNLKCVSISQSRIEVRHRSPANTRCVLCGHQARISFDPAAKAAKMSLGEVILRRPFSRRRYPWCQDSVCNDFKHSLRFNIKEFSCAYDVQEFRM